MRTRDCKDLLKILDLQVGMVGRHPEERFYLKAAVMTIGQLNKDYPLEWRKKIDSLEAPLRRKFGAFEAGNIIRALKNF